MTTLTYSPSPQQQAVLDWVDIDSGSLNVIARAGCGKTSALKLLVELLKSHPSNTHGVYVGAYNKPIADEIAAWMEAAGIDWKQARAGTVHSLGYRTWIKLWRGVKTDGKKVAKIFDATWPETKKDVSYDGVETMIPANRLERSYRDFVIDLVSYAKQRAFGVLCHIENRDEWFDCVDHFGLDENLEEDQSVETGIEMAIRIYRASLNQCRTVIDYDDMILAPLFFRARVWQFSWMLVDEAQDINPARRALILKSLRPGGRLVAVGDPAQAIYGFTGADVKSMDEIGKAMNSKTLPLNCTWRCPKTVVSLANQWVPDLTAAPQAPEGMVREITLAEFDKEPLAAGDAILCRKSAPLIDVAYSLLRRGIPCRVEGRKIGEGLMKLAGRFKVKTLEALWNRLEEYRAKETQKWLAKEKEQKAADVADSVDTLMVIIDKMAEVKKTDVSDLMKFLDDMFTDVKPGDPIVTLSTVHKSKGREWHRVFLLGRAKFMPSRWARKDWQLVQETNLMYVAVTRAKHELIDVVVPVEKIKEP